MRGGAERARDLSGRVGRERVQGKTMAQSDPTMVLPPELWSAVLSAIDPLWRPVAARVCRCWRGVAIDLAKGEAPRPPPDVPPAEALCLWERLAGVRQHAAQRSLWLRCVLLASAAALPCGAVDMLAWLRGQVDDGDIMAAAPRPIPWDASATEAAAGAGNLDALMWLDARQCPLDIRECAVAAAARGHLAILGWLRRRHETVSSLGSSMPLWHESIYAAAASCGRIDMLRWLDVEGCPRSPMAFVKAVRAGHVDVVRWLAATNGRVGPFIRPPSKAAHAAAKRGDLHTLECLYVAGCEDMHDQRLMATAASRGHVPVLAWLRTRVDPPCPWSRHVAPRAIMGCHLDALDWLVRAGCIIDGKCFAPAALRNNIPLLAWLRRGDNDEDDDRARDAYERLIADHDDDDPTTRLQKEAVRRLPGLPKACTWEGLERDIYCSAAFCDNARVLEWLRAHGLVLTPTAARMVYRTAISHALVHTAGWVVDVAPNDVSMSCIDSLRVSSMKGRPRLLAWLHDNGISCPGWAHMEAVKEGEVGLLAWMRSRSRSWADTVTPYGDRTCGLVAHWGQLDALDWLVEAGCPYDPDQIMVEAASTARYGLLKWCRTAWDWSWSSDLTAVAAMSNCPASFVAALRDSGCPWDVRVAKAYAARGDLDDLIALGPDARPSDPCPYDQTAVDAAMQNGHHHVVAYLCRTIPSETTSLTSFSF
nr:ankyrin repeat [Pandoravirus massiliensis]